MQYKNKTKKYFFFLIISTLWLANCSRVKNISSPSTTDVTPNAAPYDQPDWMESKGNGIYKVGKPYKVNGIWYFPKEDYNYDEVGFASWYGPDFHNKRTANGEIFDMDSLSAAHKTLPLPSIIRVTNLQNGRSLILRVNDRGPFVNNRLLDVSRKAAQLLGFADQGTTKVRVELLPEETMTVAALAQDKNYKPSVDIKPHESGTVEEYKSLKASGVLNAHDEDKPIGGSLPGGTYGNEDTETLFDKEPTINNEENIFDKPSIEMEAQPSEPVSVALPSKNIFIQAGAFGNKTNAENLANRLSSISSTKIIERSSNGNTLHIVKVGPFDTNGQARHSLSQVKNMGLNDARIVTE
jgi:rare lipoprotein A